MIYDKYKTRIAKLAKFLLVVRRYRFLIMSVLLTVLAITTVLLSTNGMVYGDGKCPSTIYYGQTLEYESNAFLTKVHYEYYDPASKTWTTEQPTKPGSYQVRAVSKNIFGDKKYGEIHDFKILAKELEVKVAVSTIEYGASLPVTADLVEEGTITCSLFDYIGLGSETVQVCPRAEGVKITDKDGTDITSYYTIKGGLTPLTFTARTVVLEIPDIEHVYDGQVFTSEDYTVAQGSFLPTDTVVGTFTGSVETAGEESINNAEFKVYRGEVDISSYYNIVYGPGVLTVAKRPLLIQTSKAEHIYDGTEFSAPDYTISEDTPLPEGHKLIVDDYAKITEAGSISNTLKVRVLDENDVDVTANYEVTFPEESILTVQKRSLSITSEGAEKSYDGTALENHTESIDDGYSIVEGQYYIIDWTGTLTEQGDVPNEFTIKIYIDDGDPTTQDVEVTECYNIIYHYGRLVVGYTYVTFKTESATRQYDGTPLKAESWFEMTVNGVAETLPDDFELILTDYAEIVTVGETENIANYKIVKKGDSNGNHNLNYVVTPEWGSLCVTQREISVSAVNASKVYDGTPLESDEIEWTMDIAMPADHILTADLIGSQTYFGISVNELLEENIFISHNGVDVKDCFTFISLQNGELEVTTRYLYLTTHTHTWIYDGLAHKDEGSECDRNGYDNNDLTDGIIDGTEYFLLPDGHRLVVDASSAPEIVDYDESGKCNELSFSIYATVNGVETDVTSDNFAIVFNENDAQRGKLYIQKRDLEIVSDSASKVYDGTVLTAEGYHIVSGGLAPNQSLIEETYHSGIVNVQSVENIWDFHIEDQNGNDVTVNYNIDKQNGKLEITPRYIWITTHQHDWTYDGVAHQDVDADCARGGYDDSDLTVGTLLSPDGSMMIEYMKLAPNQSLGISSYTSVTDVSQGAVNNTLTFDVYDVNGDVVTGNYVFRYTEQTIWINRRSIEIQANDVVWVYDGTEHYDGDGEGTCKAYTNADNVTAGGLPVVNGEEIALDVNSFATTLKVKDYTPTPVSNTPVFVVWRTKNGVREISDNYAITVIPGELTVERRAIFVTTHDVTWEYDGKTHYEGDAYHTAKTYDNGDLSGNTGYYYLVSGHTLSIDSARGQATVLNVADSATPNRLWLRVDENGVDVTDNYTIDMQYGSLTITPREVTVTAKSDTTVYNGVEQSIAKNAVEDDIHAQLAENQTLYYVETLGVTEKDANVYDHFIVSDSAIIHDAFGVDVTVNYSITYLDGTLTIEKRKIHILTHDHTWTYDADPHYDDCAYTESDLILFSSDYFLTLDELPVGSHSLRTSTYTAVTNVWESWTSGAGNNVMTFDVLDATDAVVTYNYEITYTTGKLFIEPLEIEIIGDSMSEMYDGTEHIIPENMYTIVPGLLNNAKHTQSVADLVVSGAVRTDVGETENTVDIDTLKIVDENGDDVTGNYEVTVVHGTLEITKRPIYVKETHTCEWVYDGESHRDGDGDPDGNTYAYSNNELVNDQIKCFGLVLDHELKPIDNGTETIQNVWESGKTNVVNFAVFYADGTENTNYEINIDTNCAFGTLNVTPRAAVITSASDSKEYDGEPLTCDKIDDNKTTGIFTDLGHTVTPNCTGSQTDAYTAQDMSIGQSDNTFDPKVYDANGQDITENYSITTVEGVLTVTKRQIIVVSKDDEKIYDGTPLTNHEAETKKDDDSKGLVLDHEIYPTYTGSVTFVGQTPNENSFTADTSQIVDSNGDNTVGNNYEIIGTEFGTLTILPRPIQVAPISKTKFYDGTPLSAHNEYDLLAGTNDSGDAYCVTLGAGDTLTVSTVATEIVNMGEVEHPFLNPGAPDAKIVWNDGVTDVTYCYEITYADDAGILKIERCTIIIQTEGAFKVYDGTPLTQPAYNVYGLPEGHTVQNLLTMGEQTIPGSSENIINTDWVLVDGDGNDVTNSGNFLFVEELGTLLVETEDIVGVLAIKPVDLIIDQNATVPTVFTNGMLEDANNGVGLWVLRRSGGYTCSATVKTVQNGTEIKTVIEEFHLYDETGADVTYKYDITYEEGKVEYKQDVHITLQLPFKEKIYDGTPLAYTATDEANVSFTTSSSDVDVTVQLAGLSRTNAGMLSKADVMPYVTVMQNGVDITDSCSIELVGYGLVVRPIEITVETQSATKIYDGTPLTREEISQPVGLLEGHTLMGYDEATGQYVELKAQGTITGVGSIENFLSLEDCYIIDADGVDVTLNYLIEIKRGTLKVVG